MHNGSLRGPREDILPNAIPEETTTPLHNAAATGDEKVLETLLASGADRNAKDAKHGNTPLHEAAWRGHSRCVKALCCLPKPKNTKKPNKESDLLKGVLQSTQGALHSALLGTRNLGGFSALHLAAQNGHNQSCREILLAGGDPDVQNNYGDTPLHTACRYGHAGSTRILLSGKCDPQRVNLNGDTAFHIACAMGRRKLTKILLEAGSSPDVKNGQGETARDIALRKRLTEILEILEKPLDEIRRDRERSSSSSHHKRKEAEAKDKSPVNQSKEKDKKKTPENPDEVNPKNWSPYGCHYFPDPRSFPSPKLETLPKEPLGKDEQYFLDLAGNIRKGPVGVGNTCYCGPFFRHIEERISRNKKSIRKYVHKATEKLDNKVQALALKTDDKIEQLTRSMVADRTKCEGRRLHLEQWLKRGDQYRSTVAPHTTKSRKDQTNANTLTKCRSLEFLDEDDVFSTKIETTGGLSRSFDLLDGRDVVIHRDAEGCSSNMQSRNGRSSSERDPRFSSVCSDRDRLSCEREQKYSEYSEKEQCSSLSDKGRFTSSEKDRNSLEGRSGSDIARQKQKRKSQVYSVAERLEELLAKTNEIIQYERSARKKNKEESKKRIKGSDRLRVSSSSTSRSQGYEDELLRRIRDTVLVDGDYPRDMDDSAFIAEEMKKITDSLLHRNDEKQPVTPEIAKDRTDYKETDADKSSIQSSNGSRNIPSSLSNCGYIPDFSKGKQSTPNYDKKQTFDSSLMMSLGSREEIDTPDGASQKSQISGTASYEMGANFDGSDGAACNIPNQNVISGFYQNSIFEDGMSSSSNTIRSGEHHEIQADVDVDDKGELSEMANFKELNELKSRILNGSHWRSQVLRKSAQEMGKNDPSADEDSNENPELQGVWKYEIKNSEIKNLKPSESEPQSVGTNRNKVHELVAKIQGKRNFTNGSSYSSPNDSISSKCNKTDDHSESSEDEDGSYRQKKQLEQQQQQQQSFNYTYQDNVGYNQSIQPDVKVPHESNYANQPYPAQAHPIRPIIDTRSLIPKDAYFHELPNKNRVPILPPNCKPVLPPKEIAATPLYPPIDANMQTFPARNRAPLPYSINDTDILQESSTIVPVSRPDLLINSGYLPVAPTLQGGSHFQQHPIPTNEYNRPIKIIPQREKLLSNRKFSFNAINNDGFYQYGPAGSTDTIVRAHPQQFDLTYHDRDASNDSGYTTKLSGGSPISSTGPVEEGASERKFEDFSIAGGYGASSLV